MKKRITYIGRRLWGEKVRQVFLLGKEEIGYVGLKWLIIGHQYFVEQKGAGKKRKLSIDWKPKHAGDPVATEEQILQWEAEDMAVEGELKCRRAYAKAKRQPGLVRLSEILKPILKDLGYIEKRKLLEALLDRIEE